MRFIHWSNKPLIEMIEYTDQQKDLFKPDGLWFSVESGNNDGWLDWCKTEEFRLNQFSRATEVILVDDANVLWIKNRIELENFTSSYYIKTGSRYSEIDWDKIKQKHDGIIIAPYLHSCRLNFMWYYSWDCAAGVIWRKRAIKSLLDVPELAFTAGPKTHYQPQSTEPD